MFNMNEWSNRLIAHEGLSLMPYRCTAGKLTIGVGRNLEDNPLTYAEKRAVGDYMHGITENAAKMLLRNDITRCYETLKRTIKNFEELSPDRQYALLDMCFQLGIKGLKRFRKMLWAIEKQDFTSAANECLASHYALQTPKRAKKIARTIKTGKW
ncbi:MAG: glycoside hydrolase family protein [Acetobacter sp.]|nr:glycoside hydrolase family protein [Acetobacter sp.]